MRRGMMNPCGLKVRSCASCMVDINKYLAVFPGEKWSENICEMELNEIMLNKMPNRWRSQACVQVFDCGSITLKRSVNFLNSCKYQNLFMKVL